MEFCEGGSLETAAKKLREQKRRVGELVVAKLAESILKGLDYLHGRKIIHRGRIQRQIAGFTNRSPYVS